MKVLLIGLSMAVLAAAKPELYREKEDFQFSRSSSDEGTKSGYYDAQRGNMGGNYERAHNMDVLAQHQMGGLVKQVQGELGDGAKTKTGSVYTAANSQGTYGANRFDLSSLAGRNFQEGATYHNSQSYSSAGSRAHSSQYSAQNNGRFNTDRQYRTGFGGSQQYNNLQEAENTYDNSNREYERGSSLQSSSKYNSQSGYQGSSDYERSHANHQSSNNFGANTQNRLISTVPVRIVVRPGTRVAIPLATQTQYTGSNGASFDQSHVNSEAEVLNIADQQAALRPSGEAKKYESSYSYHKEWEKHDTKPTAIPVAVPVTSYARNSDLYDESRYRHGSEYANNADYSSLASSHVRQEAGFNSQHSALTSASQHQAEYNAQQESASSNLHSNAYSHSGYSADVNAGNVVGTITSKPKSYQSSYSYHKSWERQGDPYVIIPPTNGQFSQRLTDLSGAQGEYSSQSYGSRKSHQTYSIQDCVVECDPNNHRRVSRSYNSDPAQFEQQNLQQSWDQQSQQSAWGQDLSQQSQNQWEKLEDLGQQTQNQRGKLEDLGQQTQNQWGNLENLGQQTQNQWGKLEDLGQQTQNSWGNIENFRQQAQDAGQQVQNKWDQLSQDSGQQAQNKWDNLEDLGQQTQNKWDQFTQVAGQQVQNQWDLGQQTQNLSSGDTNSGQEIVNGWNSLEAFGQQSENDQDEHQQHTQDNWDTQKQEEPIKPTEIEDLGQHAQAKWNPLEEQNQEHQVSSQGTQHSEHKTFDKSQAFDSQDSLGFWPNQHQPQTPGFNSEPSQTFDQQNVFEQSINHDKNEEQAFQVEDLSQQSQGTWDYFEKEFVNDHDRPSNRNMDNGKPMSSTTVVSQTNTERPKNTGSLNSLWGKLDDLDGDNAFVPANSHTTESQNTDSSQFSNSQHFSELNDQQFNNQHKKFDIWSFTDEKKNPLVDNTVSHKADVLEKTSTTENTLQVTGLTNDQDKIEKTPHNEDEIRTFDFGRGDIGPEESLRDLLKSSTEKTRINGGTLSFQQQIPKENKEQFNKPITKVVPILDDKTDQMSPDPFHIQRTTQRSIENKLTNKPYKYEREEIEQQFETQNIQKEYQSHHEHKVHQYEEHQFHYQRGDQTTWDQYSNSKPNHGDPADQQFVDFSQVNQQQDSEHQNIQQHSTDDFYQQNQILHTQNSLSTFEQHNEQSNVQDFEQQNIQQQSTDDFYQQNQTQHLQSSFTNDFDQHNVESSAPDFEQQNIQQQSTDNFYQQNENQHLQNSFTNDFDQHNVESSVPDFEQQNIQQQSTDNFYQQNQNQHLQNSFTNDFDQHDVESSVPDFEQQNLHQQFPDDFYQQKHDTQVQNSFTSDFNQHSMESTLSNLGQKNLKSEFEVLPVGEQQEKIGRINAGELGQHPKPSSETDKGVSTTPEPVSEKPGFWKSMGNKFVNAKNKVASWFS